MDEGFIDLRYGAERDPGSESFWPSFTDIMMVVLMIFMIASTILMLRNWDLVRELRATLAAEREAEALALSATQTSETLEERLAQAQHEISELRIQMLRANEQRIALNAQLAASKQQSRQLESDRKRLSGQLQTLRAESARQSDERTTLLITIDELRELEKSQAAELVLLREQTAFSEQQLVDLQGSYDDLTVKYNKLIKPARTAAGKYLVSVRYRKEDDVYLIEFKDSEGGDYEFVDRDELEARLSDLKAEYSGQLYVKVIIPKESGLSYNEAWGFTQRILTRYDYYYQD
jgi:chromosome segregation ATPase